MSKGTQFAWVLVALLAVSPAIGNEESSALRPDDGGRAAPNWIERGFVRLERAIARLEAKIAGRRGGSGMAGCEEMMSGGMIGDAMMGGMGGGMMGGARPNEQWSPPRSGR